MALRVAKLKMMVAMCALVLGNVLPSATFEISGPVTAALITSGSSIAGVPLGKLTAESSHHVSLAIQVENWTRFTLKDPSVRIASRTDLSKPAVSIMPAQREAFTLGGRGGYGTYGTVSWEIEGARRRLVVMWSVPSDTNAYVNWLGLGMTRAGLTKKAPGDQWWKQMYKGGNTRDLRFVRHKYSWNDDCLVFSNNEFEIEGTMLQLMKAQIRVILRPTSGNWGNLAPTIMVSLREDDLKELCEKEMRNHEKTKLQAACMMQKVPE